VITSIVVAILFFFMLALVGVLIFVAVTGKRPSVSSVALKSQTDLNAIVAARKAKPKAPLDYVADYAIAMEQLDRDKELKVAIERVGGNSPLSPSVSDIVKQALNSVTPSK